MPSASRAARSWRVSSCEAGVSPCVQMVSTRIGMSLPFVARTMPSLAIRTARPMTSAGEWMTAPGRVRGVREPSASYARSANPSRATRSPASQPACSRLAAGKREQHEPGVERTHRPRDRVRQAAVLDRHVVERTVRLDVLEPHAFAGGDGRERADLVEHHVLDFFGGHGHVAAPEPCEIRQAGMGAHRNAGITGQPHGCAHDARIAGVIPARDIRRGDGLHQLGVAAKRPAAERFAEIGIEVDGCQLDYGMVLPAVRRRTNGTDGDSARLRLTIEAPRPL